MVEAEVDATTGTAPTFQRTDPLNRWSLVFLIAGAAATVILVGLFALFAADATRTPNKLIIEQGQWVALVTVLLIASIVGLIFVIVGRVGGTQGGSYLSADLDAEERARNAAAAHDVGDDDESLDLHAATGAHALLRGARVVDPFGADGKILLAYSVPADGGPGVYGDVMIDVDTDAKLNIRTRLAALKTQG